MMQGVMRALAVVNVLLAGALVAGAFWLYGREHDTRQVERQIRTLQRATALEEETIRRLEIEWQRLRNPMRLEPLARLKLNLMPPDPLAVLPRAQALAMLPLRPPPVAEEGTDGKDADALSAMAEQAAQGQAMREEMLQPVADPVEEAASTEGAPAANDALGNLINGLMQNGGGQP